MAADAHDPFDEPALEALYRRLERPIYNVVYRRIWSSVEAQDIVQEAFVRLWGMRGRVRPDSVEPLVYRIALNLAAKHRRSARIRKWLTLEALRERSMPAEAPRRLELRDRAAALRAAVERLPAHLRDVVLLTEFSTLTQIQIGDALGIPAGTVGSRRHTALKQLRTELAATDHRRPASMGQEPCG